METIKIRIQTNVSESSIRNLQRFSTGEIIPMRYLINPNDVYMWFAQNQNMNPSNYTTEITFRRAGEDARKSGGKEPHNLDLLIDIGMLGGMVLKGNMGRMMEMSLGDLLNKEFFTGNFRIGYNSFKFIDDNGTGGINTSVMAQINRCDIEIQGEFLVETRAKKPKKGANRLFLLYGTGKLTDPNTGELLEEYRGQGEVTYLTFDISKRIAEILKELIAEEKEIESGYGVIEMLLEEFPDTQEYAICNMVILFIKRFNDRLKFVKENPTAPVSYVRGKRVIGIEPKSLLDDRGLTDPMKLLEAEELLFRKEHYNI